MKIIVINGSPRKDWNTDVLVKEAEKGAISKGAETEFIHLYDLNYKGCISCFGCKLVDRKSRGRCVLKDSLSPVLEKIHNCDGLILGSPIYLGEVSSSVRAFIERLIFQYGTYNNEISSFFTRRIAVGLIYTMNLPQNILDEFGYTKKFMEYEQLFDHYIGSAKTLLSTETLATENYAKYGFTAFNENDRKKRHDTIFPEDCKKAFELGVSIVGNSTNNH